MGCNTSFLRENRFCNYHCPICQQSGKTPNAGGRFFIINEFQYHCNGCNQIFEKYENIVNTILQSQAEVEVINPPIATIQIVNEFSDII